MVKGALFLGAFTGLAMLLYMATTSFPSDHPIGLAVGVGASLAAAWYFALLAVSESMRRSGAVAGLLSGCFALLSAFSPVVYFAVFGKELAAIAFANILVLVILTGAWLLPLSSAVGAWLAARWFLAEQGSSS